jgi:hypothetical protein
VSIKQFAAKDGFPFAVLFVLLLIFHIPLNTNFGDDLINRAFWEEGITASWFAETWNTWSSRLIVNFINVLFSGLPQAVWKAADICVMTAAAICVSKLFVRGAGGENTVGCDTRDHNDRELVNYRRTCNITIVSLFLMYNLYEMSSSGWVASTSSYMWSLAFGLYALLSLKKTLRQEALKKYEYPLTVAALIVAANLEQVCAVLLAVYLYCVGRAAYVKFIRREPARVSRFVILQSFICAASMAYALLCPGNSARYETETARWFPGHDALSFFEKISVGVSSTLNYFVMTPNVLFLVLSLLLSIGIFAKRKELWIRIIALTPLLVNFAAFAYVFADYFMANGTFALKNPRDIFQLYGILGTKDTVRFYIPHILYAAMICAFAACLRLFFEDRKRYFLPFCVLLLGISSRAMLGFSPTVFASSYRTYLLLNFSFIITAVIVYQDLVGVLKAKTMRYVNAMIILIALANFSVIPLGYRIVKPFFGRP